MNSTAAATIRRLLPLTLLVVCAPATSADLDDLYAQPSPFETVPRELWLLESERAYVIHDIAPRAPVHLLVIPKLRIPTLLQADTELLGEMLALAREAAAELGIAESGFRIVINTHPDGGQTVYHLHIHVLGGEPLGRHDVAPRSPDADKTGD